MASAAASPRFVSNAQITSLLRGTLTSALQGKTTPKEWGRIVRAAKAKGISTESLLDTSTPDALKPRTRAGIVAQATATVNAGYKPALTALDQQTSRIKGLDAKRASDNRYYQSWLQQQTDKLTANANASDSYAQANQRQIQSDLANQISSVQAGLQQHAAANTSGTAGENPANFKGFDLTGQATQGLNLVANERAYSNTLTGTHADKAAANSASNFALMASVDAKRVADTWGKLSDVADGRQKLVLQRSADTAKEVSRLLDQEITKAQSNRDYQAALSKLNLQQSALNEKTKNDLANIGIKQKNAATGAANAATNAANAQTNLLNAQERNRHNLTLESIDRRRLTTHGSTTTSPLSNANIGQDNRTTLGYAYSAIGAATSKAHPTSAPSGVQVYRNANFYVNALVRKLKVSRNTATAAVWDYIYTNGGGLASISGHTRPLPLRVVNGQTITSLSPAPSTTALINRILGS